MLQSKFGTLARIVIVAFALLLAGCNGSTGGQGDNAAAGDQFVADGGAGASLSINVLSNLNTAGTARFSATLLDPNGQGIGFATLFCESERGIAILEPSAGGVARGTTGPDGVLSGTIGGLLPGSWIFECRAPNGFNLVSKVRIVVRGAVPTDFQGFPGAAGGNLGGGGIVDQTPGTGDGQGVRISRISYVDAGGETVNGPIDNTQDVCDAGTPADMTDDFAEPFANATIGLAIRNDTSSRIFLQSVEVNASDGGNTGVVPVVAEVGPASTVTVSAILARVSGGGLVYTGNGVSVGSGRFDVVVEVIALDQDGNTVTLNATSTVLYQNVNNCGG